MNDLNITEVWTFLFAYLLPILFFVYMGTDIMLRNSKKMEHKLLCLTAVVYILLFLEEYIRHQLPISYSPAIVALWFSNVGIIMPGLGFHFLAKFSGMEHLKPRFMYPYIFYLPLLVIILNVLSSKEIISSSQFVQVGVWKYPVYNLEYYVALTVSILVSTLYLVVLRMGKANASTDEHKSIFNLLIIGVILCTVWHVMLGFVQLKGILPPYPYIYGGVIWCFFLRLAMLRFDFLNFVTRRYEKLFNLNPTAIVLFELTGKIKEMNPSARQLFDFVDINRVSFYTFINNELQNMIRNKQVIKEYESTIIKDGKRLEIMLDGDYVTVENEPHIILIVRDITIQKESLEEIRFLAYHDPLTRLPNRRFFYEKLHEAIQDAEKFHLRLAVILIDLDRFKETNDRFGHEAGDEVLRHTARIMRELAEPIGMAARWGGDEFVMFIRHEPSDQFVQRSIDQLQRTFAEAELQYNGGSLPILMSVGASFYPEDGRDGDTLLMNADKHMYRAKREVKNEFGMAQAE